MPNVIVADTGLTTQVPTKHQPRQATYCCTHSSVYYGDSGGPLVRYNNLYRKYILYGVVTSSSIRIAGLPGIFHYVPSSIVWIRSTIDIYAQFDNNSENIILKVVRGIKKNFRNITDLI